METKLDKCGFCSITFLWPHEWNLRHPN